MKKIIFIGMILSVLFGFILFPLINNLHLNSKREFKNKNTEENLYKWGLTTESTVNATTQSLKDTSLMTDSNLDNQGLETLEGKSNIVLEKKTKLLSEGYKWVCRVYEDEKGHRVLVVSKEYKDGKFEIVAQNSCAVLKKNEEGQFGDPLVSMQMKMKKDGLMFSFYGGSSWRWYRKFTFEFQDEDLILVNAYIAFGLVHENLGEKNLKFNGTKIQEYRYDEGKMETAENVNGEIVKKSESIDKEPIDIEEFNIYDYLE